MSDIDATHGLDRNWHTMSTQLLATCPPPATEVCLTIDTEFSIGGAFDDPINRRPIGEAFVRCPVEGVEHGLPFILRTLARFGVPATFFVETLNAAHFGDLPMRRVGNATRGRTGCSVTSPSVLAMFSQCGLGRTLEPRGAERQLRGTFAQRAGRHNRSRPGGFRTFRLASPGRTPHRKSRDGPHGLRGDVAPRI